LATSVVDTFIGHLRQSLLLRDEGDRTDGQLLDSFIDRKDESAFAALMYRHSPMVLSVCRRIARNQHDAEDAFQATFLVLVRKASSVRPRQMVANWLHGVACRTATKAKTLRAKRQMREQNVAQMPEPETKPNDRQHDLQPLLDRELRNLPEIYRLPILLCDLEGKSIKDATRQLDWPQGTLAGRLIRGRRMLAKRLSQRGVMLSCGLLAEILTQKAVSASVPAWLLESTFKAGRTLMAGHVMAIRMVSTHITDLMEDVMRSMMLSKFKIAMATASMLGLFAIGGGLLTSSTGAQEVKTEKPLAPEKSAPQEKAAPPRKASDKPAPKRASSKSPLSPSYVVESPDTLRVEINLLPSKSGNMSVTFSNCVVRTDGTISLGNFGSAPVAGCTLERVRALIAGLLAPHAGQDAKVEIQVDVTAMNSKCYYVIAKTEGKDNDTVYRFPDYGCETVVKAILQAGLAESALKGRVFLAIRSGDNWEMLEVNWRAITKEGKSDTNYVLQPGDRVYVESPALESTK
jgi:RNA polymerase sigma factor (sigma-70 family)